MKVALAWLYCHHQLQVLSIPLLWARPQCIASASSINALSTCSPRSMRYFKRRKICVIVCVSLSLILVHMVSQGRRCCVSQPAVVLQYGEIAAAAV